jgi:hypothetical protein
MIQIIVKELSLGDVEDPEVYLGPVAWDWLQTDHGAWCKERATELVYHKKIDYNTYGYKYYITATFNNEDGLMYKLKWTNTK